MARIPLIDAAAATDRCARPRNEDAFALEPQAGLFAVVDGMGGEGGGEEAALVALDAIGRSSDAVAGLRQAARNMAKASKKRAALASMGAVATVARADGALLHIAHCGDTRAYLVTELGCEQLTRDHTVAHEDQERLSTATVNMRASNVVTRDLGASPSVEIDARDVAWGQGDLLFLCSDGVHGALGANELSDHLVAARREGTAPQALVNDIVRLARMRGTGDNATAVAAFHRGERSEALKTGLNLAAIAIPLLALGIGLVAGQRFLGRTTSPVPRTTAPPVLVEAAVDPSPDVDLIRGPGFPETLTGEIALGVAPITVATPLDIAIPAGTYSLRAIELGGESSRVTIRVPEGTTLRVSLCRFELPQGDVEFVLEGRSSVVIIDRSHISSKRLRFAGPAGSRVSIDRASFSSLPPKPARLIEGVELLVEERPNQ